MKMTMESRRSFVNRVLGQFDKYVEYLFPVPFDPVADVYRHSFTHKEWIALRYLMQQRPDVIQAKYSFDLYYNGSRQHVTFRFPEEMTLPGQDVKVVNLPNGVRAMVEPWLVSVNYMRKLRSELHDRCNGLVGNALAYHRMDELDPCCNTPGQIIRIWPELQPFLGTDHKARVRQAAMKSRLPDLVGYKIEVQGALFFATPAQFQCKEWKADNDDRRRFEELSEILVKMSLMQDMPHVERYPIFSH